MQLPRRFQISNIIHIQLEMSIYTCLVSQTLSRTILTSLSTLAVLVCLYFFGGPSMEDFAWTISAGILIGTYSSIFIRFNGKFQMMK